MSQGHEYSLYSESSIGRIRIYGLLGIAAVIIVGLLREFVISQMLTPKEPIPTWVFYFGAASPLVVFGLLVLCFDRFAWHWPIAKPIYLITQDKEPPYIHGTYEGKVTWRDQVNNDQKESEVTVRILQQWQKLVVIFEFFDEQGNKRAGSNSDMAYIEQGMDKGNPTLQYTYSYEGNETRQSGGIRNVTINGTAIMNFERNGDKWKITGRYYSDDAGSGNIYLRQSV